MIIAQNTTTDARLETDSFDKAFAWGISQLPGPIERIEDNYPGYKAEFEDDGKTFIDDCCDRCYNETVKIWKSEIYGMDWADDECD